jgi:flagellar hook-associated protein 3 FlgL
MRISTNMIFNSGTSGILNNQAAQLKTYNQIATGRRVVTPEDDPVAASQVLVNIQAQEVNKRYMENQGQAKDSLKLVETQLNTTVNTMQEILDKTIQAGNTTLNDANRAAIATELEERLKELVSVANSQDGNGHYLFSGYQSTVRPFNVSGTAGPYYSFDPTDLTLPANNYVTFNGDQGTRELQVDASRQMPISESGADIFMRVRDRNGNISNQSIFDTVQNLVDTLKKPVANDPVAAAALPGEISKALDNLYASKDNAVRVRSSVGARLSELDSLGEASSDIDVQYSSIISNLRDLDYASALSDLSKQQVQLQAAQKAFTTVSSLNLFSML